MQQCIAAHREGCILQRDERAIGQLIDLAPVQALGTAAEAFGVQYISISPAHGAKPARLSPFLGKSLRISTAALEAGPMPGRKRGWLVKKKQLGVKTAPDLAPATLEVEHATNPLPRRPTSRRQRPCVGMKTPAAVAHEQPARGPGRYVSKGAYSILQRHC